MRKRICAGCGWSGQGELGDPCPQCGAGQCQCPSCTAMLTANGFVLDNRDAGGDKSEKGSPAAVAGTEGKGSGVSSEREPTP